IQLSLAARGRRGGWRARAGRKRKAPEDRKGHGPRPELASRFPVHVTLSVREGLPSLRECFRVVRGVLGRSKERLGFRMVQFSVQGNHVHLLCEAKDKQALTGGMQSLVIRLALALNRELGRRGKVFAERYHSRILRSPTEVRHVLAYVLNNWHHHA